MEHGPCGLPTDRGSPTSRWVKLRALAINKTYAIVNPYPDPPNPVVASALDKQSRLETAKVARLKQFVNAFRQGSQAPEPGARRTNGTSATTLEPSEWRTRKDSP